MPAKPTTPAEAAYWMRVERDRLGWSTTVLADRAREVARREGSSVALPQQSISNFEQGSAKRMPEWLRYVRIAINEANGEEDEEVVPPRVDEAGHRDDRPEQAATRTADIGDVTPVLRLDMSYSMGPGTELDESYVEGEYISFDHSFLRTLTITPPDRIRVVDGVGDSMQPTIHDRDLLFVDINQRDLNAQDRIWACWIYGMGAVKRLRVVSEDRVLVISDNPDVDNQEVARKDILIHGRVVGSIKRH